MVCSLHFYRKREASPAKKEAIPITLPDLPENQKEEVRFGYTGWTTGP